METNILNFNSYCNSHMDRAQTNTKFKTTSAQNSVILSILRTTCLVQRNIQIYQVISFYDRDGVFTARYELKNKIYFRLILVLRPSYVIWRLMVISLWTNTVLIVHGRRSVASDVTENWQLSSCLSLPTVISFKLIVWFRWDVLHIYRVFRFNKRYEICTHQSVSSDPLKRILPHHTHLKV